MLPLLSAAGLVALTSLFTVPASAVPQTPSSSSVSPPSPSPSPPSSPSSCNGSPELCDRQYNQITHMGAHDSSFLRDASTNFSVSGNQFFNATMALDRGLRLLQVQVHDEDGELRMCHTSCVLLDAGLLGDWLALVSVWMDAHPNEVVTLVLVNADEADAARWGAEFERSGIAKYGYALPTPGGPAPASWPTLAAMIAANTRLVSFVAPITPSAAYPYLLNEFDYVFETDYDVATTSGFNCTLDRPESRGTAESALSANYLGMINHMKQQTIVGGIYVPDVAIIDDTNSADQSAEGALGLHVSRCQSEWGVQPQLVLVDFFDRGDVMAVTNAANRLSSVAPDHGNDDVPEPAGPGEDEIKVGSAKRNTVAGSSIATLVALVATVVI